MYASEQALADFRRLATAAGANEEQIEQAIEWARPTKERQGVGYLAELIKALNDVSWDFEDFFLKASGLYNLTLADEDSEYDITRYLRGEARKIFKKGSPVAYYDADRWVVVDGVLYHVHPEGCSEYGPLNDYINKQVEAALSDG